LQEMQPGLEKVYFTLQEELLKPQAQMLYKPAQGIDTLVREPILADAQQQVAEVLLTAARPKPPARWAVDPALERRQKMETQIAQIGSALFFRANQNQPYMTFDKTAKKWSFNADLIDGCVKDGFVTKEQLTDPMGTKITLDSLTKFEKLFTVERLAEFQTKYRMEQLGWTLANYATQHQADFLKDGKWTFPDSIIADAAKNTGFDTANWLKDAWGSPYKLVKREKKVDNRSGHSQFDYYEFVSAGPDGKFDTADDLTFTPSQNYALSQQWWWMPDESRQQRVAGMHTRLRGRQLREEMFMMQLGAGKGAGGFPGPVGGRPPAPTVAAAPRDFADGNGGFPDPRAKDEDKAGDAKAKTAPATEGAAAPPTRLREYFPETLLWQPALITDDKGMAQLHFNFADSITTWRLTASASSKGGSLGGVSAPLRVFQDFFVDIDLPVALTQNDEVAFPVAVYNYLKTPQTVKLQLEANPTFELTDGEGLTRSLDLKPNEVTSVKFRIRAKKVGSLPLMVTATGSKASDKIQRVIDVVPNGRKVEQVVADRLAGHVSQTIVIPNNAIEDSSQLYVKVYPGVFSQVLEGVDGILRMPGGCMEQTSSSAYPNVLVVDYIKKNKLASPAILLKSEQYLNVGYQRLLTFERPGGGFDWWGSGEPLMWLSAYGLQEFNDMAKVYPIDRGVIQRTQAWLLKQREADGTWSKIGATHSVSIERMGDPKLLLTSYVTWSLLDSGVKPAELSKAIEYIRANAPKEENAYVLALAANALAACDAQDDSTHQVLVKVLKKIDEQKQDKQDWKASFIPSKGQSLSYARDDGLIVETTAMAVLAMLKNGQFGNSVNQCLLYLIKSKDPHGTWGSTQATILALKALVAASGGIEQKGEVTFTVVVNGKEVESKFINEKNADVMQLIDCNKFLKPGANEVTIDVKGESNLMYQIVGRHFEPWKADEAAKPTLAVAVDYDRTKLSTADLLRAKATLTNNGKEYASMVMVDLGIPPGFAVDAGDFAEMVAAKKVNKFSVTARQVTLYLSDVKPGDSQSFEYTLKPKYPIKAQTPSTVVYEYYTPKNRGTAKPVEITVEEKK
jgi:A-macroglobulin TED domain/Alpha-2-macroglobulin family/A-macroglobulin receptor binding domain